VLNDVPAGDSKIDVAVQGTEAALLHLGEQRENLLDALQQSGPSSALTERLRGVEEELAKLREMQEDLLIQQADTAGLVVARKVANLQAVLRRKPLDRAAANALLRQLFTGVVVDYTGKTQVLVLRWRQGGESTVVYGMDGERHKGTVRR